MSHLIYFIKDAYLVGDLGSKHFQFRAVSGGHAGSQPDRSIPFIVNNPYLIGQEKDDAKGIAGGPLPCGRYFLRPDLHRHSHKHPKILIKWIDLIPDATAAMGTRKRFAIHGHGEIGSDGCIVPVEATHLNDLYYAVLDEIRMRKGEVELSVVAGELDDGAA